MTEREEEVYTRGQRSAWTALLRECLKQLGYTGTEAEAAAWVTEREESVAVLRRACAEWGDNEWNEDLHIADVIDKHLVGHLGREATA